MKQTVKVDIEQKVVGIVADILVNQIGENASMMRVYLSPDFATIFIRNALSPAERKLALNENDMDKLRTLKQQEFALIKPTLKKRLEKALGESIHEIHSLVDRMGERFLIVVFERQLN